MRVRRLGRPIVGKLIGLAAIAALLLGARWFAFSVQDVGTVSASARSADDDRLWLSHLWVDGRKNDADVQALAARLRTTGIRDVFVHTGPFNDDGSLNPALRPEAERFVGEMHRLLPAVRVQAWLGDEVEPSGGTTLESAATRGRIVSSIRSVLTDGFDGVHLDFEPIGNADPGYLTLLDQVGPVVHAAGAILSVSAEQVEPLPGSRWVMEAFEGHSGTPDGRDFGVALYLDYTATASDWAAYRSDWVSPDGDVGR